MQVEKVRGMRGRAPDLSGVETPNSLEGPEAKATQQEAVYTDGTQSCANCRHFEPPDACARVEGPISSGGHSKYYEPGEPEQESIEPAVEESTEFGE